VILALSVAARRAPAIPRAHTNNSRIERHEAPAVTDTFDGVVGFDESFIWPLHRGVVDDLGREALARVLALVWPSARLTCAGLAAPEALHLSDGAVLLLLTPEMISPFLPTSN